MIDSHTHLYWKKYDDDRQAVIDRAESAGVEAFIVVGIDPPSCRQAIEMAEKHDNMFATAGFHPTSVGDIQDHDWDDLRVFLGHEKVVAVGETGLDFYWDTTTPEEQEASLMRHFDLAREFDLPMVIHTRDSIPQFLDKLEEQAPGLTGVMHCFSGTVEDMHRTIELGFDVSFAGPLTYKKNDELREALKAAPTDRFHIETDCPFLPPQSHRGKRNEPALVREVAEKAAEVRGISLEELMTLSAANTRRLFKLP